MACLRFRFPRSLHSTGLAAFAHDFHCRVPPCQRGFQQSSDFKEQRALSTAAKAQGLEAFPSNAASTELGKEDENGSKSRSRIKSKSGKRAKRVDRPVLSVDN